MELLQLHTVCLATVKSADSFYYLDLKYYLVARVFRLQTELHAISGHPTTHRSVKTSLNALPSFISRHFSDSGSFFSAAKWISVYPRSSRLFKIFGSRSALFKMSSNLGVFSTRVGSSGGSITFIILLMIRPVCLVPEVDILLCQIVFL